MRLAEKTIELNLCAQLSTTFSGRIIWFGLTQQQEARAGYDAYARLGGRLIALQFKASDHVLRSGCRRFHAQHHQLVALRDFGKRRPRCVFYVFPGLGNTRELSLGHDLIPRCQVLDAGSIPNAIGAPTGRNGTLRKSGRHYVDVSAGSVTIHSAPTLLTLEPLAKVLEHERQVTTGDRTREGITRTLNMETEQIWFDELIHRAGVGLMGAIILPSSV